MFDCGLNSRDDKNQWKIDLETSKNKEYNWILTIISY